MIELYMLVQLVAIAESGTISKAAEQLHISQPALSRTINKIEDILQVKLFERSKNKVTLNENGLLAVEYAKKVLSASDELVKQVRRFNESRSTITILSCAPAPMWILSDIIPMAFPDIKIRTLMDQYENMEDTLLTEKCDLLILPYQPQDDRIKSVKLVEESLMITLPADHRLAAYPEISFSDLNGETMLLYSDIGYWHDIHKKNTPDTKYILQSEYENMAALVKASALPSFVSTITKDMRNVTNRVVVPIKDPDASAVFYCCWRKADNAKLKSLTKLLTEENISQAVVKIGENKHPPIPDNA